MAKGQVLTRLCRGKEVEKAVEKYFTDLVAKLSLDKAADPSLAVSDSALLSIMQTVLEIQKEPLGRAFQKVSGGFILRQRRRD